ncbi:MULTISPECIES: hypothetical protein [unclassified Bacillus (in: firmicutes)]|uniref:hypothetical protein n=1 Tax=unclassified Bacillus (in: firmicutes) TaxID=185979 RepID=UPI001C3F1E46|nr:MULTISPECIES: hypothetical protein [unclassified Bacillus (in: firmicutes)]
MVDGVVITFVVYNKLISYKKKGSAFTFTTHLTQETQNGKAAKEMAAAKPNPMINGHQDWIDGLAQAAAQHKRP